MKKHLVIIALALLAIAVACEDCCTTEEGIIESHNTSSDKYGNISYNTLIRNIRTGSIENFESADLYLRKIGDTVVVRFWKN